MTMAYKQLNSRPLVTSQKWRKKTYTSQCRQSPYPLPRETPNNGGLRYALRGRVTEKTWKTLTLPLSWFPHCERITREFHSTVKQIDTIPGSIYKSSKRLQIKNNVVVIYNTEDVIPLITGPNRLVSEGAKKEYTREHSRENPTAVVLSFPYPDMEALLQLEKTKEEFCVTNQRLQNIGFICCIRREDLQTKRCQDVQEILRDERIYLVENDVKPVRAALSYLIEQPVIETVTHMLQYSREEENNYILVMYLNQERERGRRETRFFSSLEKNPHGQSKTLALKRYHELYPDDIKEAYHRFSLLQDKLVSLLNETMKEPTPSDKRNKMLIKAVPRELQHMLKGVKEVVAFGFIGKSLEIWLDKNRMPRREEEVENLLSSIQKNTRNIDPPPLVRIMMFSPSVKIKPGDKLYPSNQMCSYGTVGTFAKSITSDEIVGVTIEHVLLTSDHPYVNTTGGRVQLGQKIKMGSSDMRETVSFIEVSEQCRMHISLQIEHEGQVLKSSLYNSSEDLSAKRQAVYKKGASLQWSRGIVVADKMSPEEQGVLVQGDPEDGPFSAPGDSGSAVFRFRPDDPEDEDIEIISILSGDYKDAETEQVLGTMTFRLKGPLERLSERKQTNFVLR